MNKDYIFVVTTYNCEKYIHACITSLLLQTDKDFGIIFVDDASTDNTVDKIRDLSRDIPNEHIIHVNETRTRSAAWNQRQAVIKYVTNPNSRILILDGDDTLYNDNSLCTIKLNRGRSKQICEAGTFDYAAKFPTKQTLKELYRVNIPYHLRYAKAWLYKAVPESMYYNGDELIKAGSDIAFVYPVIDLLGGKFFRSNQIVYKWNNHYLTHNDHFANKSEQRDNTRYVVDREKLSPLSESEIEDFKNNFNS